MVTMSIRASKGRIIAGVIVVIGIGLVIWAAVSGHLFGSQEVVKSEKGTVEQNKNTTLRNNEDRLSYITSFGYEVNVEPAEIVEIIIPKEFEQVYSKYNDLQKKSGFDLLKYAGKRCKRYTYQVNNYPDYTGEVRLNLLIWGNKLIGGDVCSLELDGFMTEIKSL